jgi:hypothetical protein
MEHCRNCAAACRKCADECRNMAQMPSSKQGATRQTSASAGV